ncbi:MAG: hypothetical protein IIB74_11400, partial [Proteobacteria bacterium]|nr:hypothetical protein [Pseudomonadota bacterium]
MAAEGGQGALTSGQYIAHHLQNLQVCKAETGEWVWNQCAGNPMALNVDSMFFSLLLGVVFIWSFGKAARKATSGVPGKLQAFVEIIVGFVDSIVKESFQGKSKLVAPLALMGFEGVRPWGKAIAKAVSSKYMPPWFATEEFHGVFRNERSLTETEIETIVKWVGQGARRGNPSDAPIPLTFTNKEWWLGEPDLIVQLPEKIWVSDEVEDWQPMVTVTLTEDQLPEDRWIKAAEFRPGSEAVHHIIARPIGGIAPGNAPRIYRDGYAAKLKAGSRIVWNMHYHKEPGAGTGMWDQSSVGIKFYPKGYVPEHVLTTIPLGPMDFKI